MGSDKARASDGVKCVVCMSMVLTVAYLSVLCRLPWNSSGNSRAKSTDLHRVAREQYPFTIPMYYPVCRLCGSYLAILGRPIRITVHAVTVAPTALVGSLIRSSNLPHSLQRSILSSLKFVFHWSSLITHSIGHGYEESLMKQAPGMHAACNRGKQSNRAIAHRYNEKLYAKWNQRCMHNSGHRLHERLRWAVLRTRRLSRAPRPRLSQHDIDHLDAVTVTRNKTTAKRVAKTESDGEEKARRKDGLCQEARREEVIIRLFRFLPFHSNMPIAIPTLFCL